MTDWDRLQVVLTAKEYEAFRLEAAGVSQRSIALALGITRGSVRDRLASAHRKAALLAKEEAA